MEEDINIYNIFLQFKEIDMIILLGELITNEYSL